MCVIGYNHLYKHIKIKKRNYISLLLVLYHQYHLIIVRQICITVFINVLHIGEIVKFNKLLFASEYITINSPIVLQLSKDRRFLNFQHHIITNNNIFACDSINSIEQFYN